jgi:hypothetical protein
MGEFSATYGGHLVRVEANYHTKKMDQLVKGDLSRKEIDLSDPLEKSIESKPESCWDPRHLEYRFKLENSPVELTSDDYNGTSLDWYHFDLSKNGHFQGETERAASVQVQLNIMGCPPLAGGLMKMDGSIWETSLAPSSIF